MRIAFFGTPDFAVPCLEALLRAKREVVCVVTQPDKPKGRGQEMQAPPVKAVAQQAGLPVLQPASVKTPPFAPVLAEYRPDIAVVVAYGKILPKALLETPRLGCINVHGSILPRWRGAAPIQWAVLAGDRASGVSTMQLDEGMDTGDVLLTRDVELAPDETAGSLFARLAPLGAELLLETLDAIEKGTVRPVRQDPSHATHARMLEKGDGRLVFEKPAAELDRVVRGTNPWPGAFTHAGGKLLKVHRVSVREGSAEPGKVLGVDGDGLVVGTGRGLLVLREVQPEGGKRMTGAEFARGRGAAVERFGEGIA